MTSEDMVTRVARAINKAGLQYIREYKAAKHAGTTRDPHCIGWADVPEEVFARAAIEALSEPTQQQVDAMIASVSGYPRPEAVRTMYRAAFRAALTSEKP